jgi:rhamnose transport system permease protein
MIHTRKRLISLVLKPEINIAIFLTLSLVIGTIMSPYFLDLRYLLNSTTIYAEFGIIAIAFTVLMISGEIDLSVASMMTLSACVAATLYQAGVSMQALIPFTVLFGAALGLINGLIVTLTNLPSLIVTLGTMSLYRGIAQVLIGDNSISGFPSWFIGADTKMVFWGIPYPFFILLVFAVLIELVLKKTFFGRKNIAIGLNSHVAKYSLVNVKKVKVINFVNLGAFCAIAGLLSMSRLQLAKYNIGIGGELDVITMVLLGGTAFEGGKGSAIGTAGAFLIIVLVRTSMMLQNLTNHAQMAVIGGLLILVLTLSAFIESIRNKYFNS